MSEATVRSFPNSSANDNTMEVSSHQFYPYSILINPLELFMKTASHGLAEECDADFLRHVDQRFDDETPVSSCGLRWKMLLGWKRFLDKQNT